MVSQGKETTDCWGAPGHQLQDHAGMDMEEYLDSQLLSEEDVEEEEEEGSDLPSSSAE